MNRLKVTFSKKGLMVYISHLDVMRLFQRSLRRTGLPISFTKGFNPHPRISMTRALKLGVESDSEEAVFYFDSRIDSKVFKEAMNSQLPDGIRIEDVTELE